MTGLEKIISQIEYESNDRCRTIIEQAEKKAEELLAAAKAEAGVYAAQMESETEKKLENIRQSAQSSAELAQSKILLKAKFDAIEEMLAKALDALKDLPAEEYFEILKTLIVCNAGEGEGVLRLCEKDLNRLPSAFVSSVNKVLSGGKSVALGEAAAIDSGFVLVYGDIDVNCSFDAIAAAKRDELRDALNRLLFLS